MNKAVFLTSLNNSTQRGGAYLRVFAVCEVLRKLGFSLELLYQDQISARGTLSKWLAAIKYGKEIKPLFTYASLEVNECDFLILDNFRYLHWNYSFSSSKRKPKIIYNAHNLEFENHYGKNDGPKRRKFSLYEANQLNLCDYILVCSEREKNLLIELNGKLVGKIFVLPNLIDKNNYSSDTNKQWITFLGTLDYFPNREAVDFLLSTFLDELTSSLKDKLVIAGRNPTSEMRELCKSKGVKLLTNLEDREVKDLLAQTKISLVPLKSGSGTRLKIVESLFSKAIVVSTPMGAEGIDEKGLIISELSNFAKECEKAFLDKDFADICPSVDFDNYQALFDIGKWYDLNGSKLRSFLHI
ncbi:MAG: hypothetical protein CME60_10005 [Halobacteriovoraceae bacterium]|nr:hypothetical protein [Halobacteriovoraceae bacterium]